MDEDDTVKWVLVNEIDCGEDALLSNALISIATDSDQESDGSITVLTDHPTDSYSEEERESPADIEYLDTTTSVNSTDIEDQVLVNDDDNPTQVSATESSNISKESLGADVSESVSEDPVLCHQDSDGGVSSTSEFSSKQWTYVAEKSELELNISKKPFYLDCSLEPVLEMSPTETEIDTESTASGQESQKIVRKQEFSISTISNRESLRDGNFNRIGIGLLISVMVLIGSHLIQQYSEYQDDIIQSPSESFLEGLVDNEKARAVIDFCVGKQKLKGEYSDHAVEKCVLRRLRKKNKEEALKKTEIYLQIKERILELREKQLVEKEKEMLRKWKQRRSSGENGNIYKKDNYGMETSTQSNSELNNKFMKQSDYKGKKRRNQENYFQKEEKEVRDENKPNYFQTKRRWNTEKYIDKKHKKDVPKNEYPNKKFKKLKNIKEETLKIVKEKVKSYSKQNKKGFESDQKRDLNEEWYVKYNPVKNTIELINITTLPKQDSLLIRNGNKTINGQWYFSLYGVSRSNIRNKEKVAEWYFKRGHFRENKRNKAKWYFDYMSARDDTRYMY